jgi:hypothetical protein
MAVGVAAIVSMIGLFIADWIRITDPFERPSASESLIDDQSGLQFQRSYRHGGNLMAMMTIAAAMALIAMTSFLTAVVTAKGRRR